MATVLGGYESNADTKDTLKEITVTTAGAKTLLNVDVGSLLTIAIAYGSNGLAEYVGEAAPGTAKSAAGWRIKKNVYDSNNRVVDVLWAEGNADFDKVWNNRASYSYS